MENLRKLIREVPDFPKPGINFYDITTLLKDPTGLEETIDALTEQCRGMDIDTVIGIESRGFIFATPLAYQLGAGWDMDIHQVGHTHVVPREAMGDVVAWHVGHFARLVRLLKETPEYDGSSVLDHTVLVLCFEGGHGEDPTDGSYSTHSTENMSVIVAGRAGGLQPGQHIDGARRHPAQATLSAMRAAGYAGTFGDFDDGIDELYG